jgi:protoporphyrinogen/coproporphyrinogen III oxidase
LRHLGVIGGGIAGLTVAFRRASAGDAVTLFEASERIGGQLHSEHSNGFIIEHGAEGFVAGSEAVAAVARDVGIHGALLEQLVTTSCRFDGEHIVQLPPGQAGRMLGFQVASRAFGKGIQSFALGMDQLSRQLGARLPPRATCRLLTRVQRVTRSGKAWSVVPDEGEPVTLDTVIVATSAAAAARMLGPEFGETALALARSEAVSSVTVSLAYRREQIGHPLDATGFVVAEEAQHEGFRACTFVSSKLAGRAPDGSALLRIFLRPTPDELAALTDRDWTERAVRALGRALIVDGAPLHSWVARWDAALPVFDAAHTGRVERLEAAIAGSGIRLAGAAFHGSGIDGAVRSAEAAASALEP